MVDDARLVVSIARAGSLTGAAERLDLSVGTVSRRLAGLERELGVTLFERTTRSLRTTAAGRELALGLERGVEEIDRAMRRIRDQEGTVVGVVRATVPPHLASVFAPIMSTFQSTHPDVRIQLIATESRLSYSFEELDVLVRVGELDEEDLVARPLISYRHIVCAHPALASRIQTLEALESTPALVWGSRSGKITWQLQRLGDTRRLQPRETLLTNDYDLIARMLAAGNAVGELPALIAQPLLEAGRLAEACPDWQLPAVSLTALYAPRLLPRAVRAFVDHLRGSFADLVDSPPEGVR